MLYAVRHEWAVYADDVIARRTRLAFLNKNAALRAIPRVVELMAQELGWDEDRQYEERYEQGYGCGYGYGFILLVFSVLCSIRSPRIACAPFFVAPHI